MLDLTVERFTGHEIDPYIRDLARLRMEIFRDFPYLYEGSQDYEERYLRTYSEAPESVFVVAFAGEEVVGVSTGLPMEDGDETFSNLLSSTGMIRPASSTSASPSCGRSTAGMDSGTASSTSGKRTPACWAALTSRRSAP